MNAGSRVFGQIAYDPAGSLRRAGRIAAFAGFTAVAAQMAVHLPWTPVPVTMQTLFVLLAGLVLGPRDGFYAMVAYLGAGLAGAPVFAGFAFGPAVLFGPTGGYLLFFPVAAMIAGAIAGRQGSARPVALAASLAGTAVILLGGALYLALLSGQRLSGVFAMAVAPFVLVDVIKAVLAAAIPGRLAER